MFEDASELTGWVVFGAIGLLLLVIALGIFIRTRRFVSQSLAAEGEVVALVEDDDDDGKSYAPRVRFTAANGVVVEFTDKLYTRPAQYRPGDRAKVLYHRNDFYRARLASGFRLYFMPFLLGSMGALFFGIAALGFLLTLWLLKK